MLMHNRRAPAYGVSKSSNPTLTDVIISTFMNASFLFVQPGSRVGFRAHLLSSWLATTSLESTKLHNAGTRRKKTH